MRHTHPWKPAVVLHPRAELPDTPVSRSGTFNPPKGNAGGAPHFPHAPGNHEAAFRLWMCMFWILRWKEPDASWPLGSGFFRAARVSQARAQSHV